MNERTTEAANSRQMEILAAQVGHAYRQLPISLLVSIINGAILTAILWGTVSTEKLILWFIALSLVTGIRLLLFVGYRAPRYRAQATEQRWAHRFILGVFAAGVVWGAAGVALFHPDSFPHQVFLAFALGGMAAGGLPLLSFLPPAYHCFAIPISIPIMLEMLGQGDGVHLTMALMILIFLLAMLSSSHQFHRIFRDSIDLRLRLSSSLAEKRELEQLARIDQLTGIANRRLFDEALATEWKRAQRHGRPLALIMGDIDYFKRYNDHLGHLAGDACLSRVAEAIATEARRPGDLAARIGGEEFAFLLPDTTAEDAAVLAERIREDVLALDIPHPASLIDKRVTISLGVAALIPAPDQATSDLVHAADVALYRAKHEGRNRVVRSD